MRTAFVSFLAAAVALTLAACGGDDDGTSFDAPRLDAADLDATGIDAADVDAANIDAADIDAADIDAMDIDAADIDAADIDAADIDASIDAPIDAPPDAPPDASIDAPTPSDLIGAARAAIGAVDLPIVDATVTYLKPAIGNPANDPAGFTIQAALNGPALMVAVDPATLTPAPTVGDVVSFTITNVAVVGSQPRATAITGYVRVATGASVDSLAQSVGAATDLLTAIDSYDSEVIDVTGSITGAFGASGSGFERAQINTAGMAVADPNFQLRVPATFRDASDLVTGCVFSLDNTPVGRFNAQTQLAAFTAADLALNDCPDPTVLTAVATSGTSVQLTFSRNILPASVLADASQFTISGGLTVSAPVVSGRTVTLTTSTQQVMLYTVTVANTVTDLIGAGVEAPGTTMFAGFVPPAVLRFNEVNANISSSCDLIEMRVVVGGALTGMRVQERDIDMVLTFPSIVVPTNSLLVIHLNSGSATCNPTGATSETTGPSQFPQSAVPQHYDTAYDLWSPDSGLTFTDTVLTLFGQTNQITEAVFLSDDPAGTAAAATETAASAAAAATQWQMVGGGVPAGGFVDDSFNAHAALDLNATGNNATGNTIQRLDNTDDNDKDDWNSATVTVQAHTWGLLNAGQTPF